MKKIKKFIKEKGALLVILAVALVLMYFVFNMLIAM